MEKYRIPLDAMVGSTLMISILWQMTRFYGRTSSDMRVFKHFEAKYKRSYADIHVLFCKWHVFMEERYQVWLWLCPLVLLFSSTIIPYILNFHIGASTWKRSQQNVVKKRHLFEILKFAFTTEPEVYHTLQQEVQLCLLKVFMLLLFSLSMVIALKFFFI